MTRTIEIIPAVLPESFDELTSKLFLVEDVARTVHVDVCDGVFVPHVSWPYHPEDAVKFSAIVNEEEGLPLWQKFDFVIHLMVMNPERVVTKWLTAGASSIIVHAEAIKDFQAIRTAVSGMTELGLALKLETPLTVLEPFVDNFELLHLMTISRIGFQGSAFEAGALAKIREARRRFPDITISVDGGVSPETIPKLVAAGADRLIMGSALFGEDDVAQAYRQFERLANEGL